MKMFFMKKGELFSHMNYVNNYNIFFVFALIFTLNINNVNCNIATTTQSQTATILPPTITSSTITTSDQHVNIKSTEHIKELCIQKCPDQNRTNSEHFEVGCGSDCYIKRCTLGCNSWEEALDTSCQTVCNKTGQEFLETKELYCVMGCNDALNRYFKWLKGEIGTTTAPALVADTLTATSLSLEWEIPTKLMELTKGKPYTHRSYLVQWRYEEVAGDWKFCRNQSMGVNSTVRVDNLLPYTKYRFRIAILLSPNHDEVLVSKQSVIISTLESGVPLSEPEIVRAVAVDQTRISVSWEPGPFPNGPVLSYVLQIKDITMLDGYSAIKDIPTTTHYYMFEKLTPLRNYSIAVSMRNAEGEGPAALTILSTLAPPQIKKDEPKPILILGAEYSILLQGSDLLAEPPKILYVSDYRIMGMAIHIPKKLLFISDESGFIYKAPLEEKGPKTAILSPESKFNFFPILLSIDWLNDHLYILGEVNLADHKVWQISRCGLDGKGLTTAAAGLHLKPSHIEVDPYNGYLFWVVSGNKLESGLFRLDLGDISNGIKHEVKPLHMIQGEDLGAFAVDHTRFRLLVPLQSENIVHAVSLDGKDREIIRKNVNSAKFYSVKSLAVANGLFYWTNGEDVLAEDYHILQKKYYHNAYPDLAGRTLNSIKVYLPSAQPIPVPLNPPSNVQALLTSKKAKVSWQIPHLLGNQGKGAWQEWDYELEVTDDNHDVKTFRPIRGTTFIVHNLLENTNYTFRAAAYTSIGKGPWSLEFNTMTLNSPHERFLIWSSSEDGLLQSDVIGEHIQTIIPRSALGDHFVSDITWFEDVLYIVSNSTLKFYNRTTSYLTTLGELDSVESVAIDSIGKRLYWSNPTQMLITRGNLYGDQQEPLPILAVAHELKIDSLRGDIYYSTGHAVETCHLNGKNKKSYFNDKKYSEQVIGLTLDLDNERVYWIVRSYEGKSLLINAPLAGSWSDNVNVIKTTLNQKSLYGPLTHFSNRLLWLQDNDTVTIGDMQGQNLAHIKNLKLKGLKAVSIIDQTHRLLPNELSKINVIPEPINNASITIGGTWKSFNISWESIKNVNYGDIFYEIRIHHAHGKKDLVKEIGVAHFHYTSHSLPPYTLLDITVRAYTYWGSSPAAKVNLYSPAAAPSAPTNPRIFLSHLHDPLRGGLNIVGTFRWNEPIEPNGPILGYKFFCWYEEEGIKNRVYDGLRIEANKMDMSVLNLVQNVSYFFEVQALTGVGSGEKTSPLGIHTNQEKPVPEVLVSNTDHIQKIDLDLEKITVEINSGHPVMHMAYINREERLFWINENNELMSYNGTGKVKLISVTTTVSSLTVDWIARTLYWSQTEKNGSSIHSFNLNRYESGWPATNEIVKRNGLINNLQISPHHRILFWVELTSANKTEGELMTYQLDNNVAEIFFKKSTETCLNKTNVQVGQPLCLDSTGEMKVIWTKNKTGIFSTGIDTRICNSLGLSFNSGMTEIVKDSGRLYWITKDTVHARNDYNNLYYQMNVTGATSLLAFYHQSYPSQKCLYPLQRPKDKTYKPVLLQTTENSLKLQFPQPEVHISCRLRPSGIKYIILYKKFHSGDDRCNSTSCDLIESYDSIKIIDGLRPFSKYQFSIGINNYYGEMLHYRTIFGPTVVFSTAPGAPSTPEKISADPVSPTEAVVQWQPPKILNADSVWYDVHWQTENTINGVKNNQQQRVPENDQPLLGNNNFITINLTKLLPSQSYNIWVRAYTSESTFSESRIIQIETYSEPENITMISVSAYSLQLSWKTQINISRYVIQHVQLGSHYNATNVYDSMKDPTVDFKKQHLLQIEVKDLQPKTQYKFLVSIYYPKRSTPFIWPTDSRFIYETLGDKPSSPGKPVIKHLRGELYQVSWDPSKDNGAPLEEYSLEALLLSKRVSNRIVRSTNTSYTPIIESVPSIEEIEPVNVKWTVQYNGSNTYWIVKDLHPINLYTFKVRARNLYGWGPYSFESEPIREAFVSPEEREYIVIGSIGAAVFVAVMLLGCLVYCCCARKNEKKMYPDITTIIPDVELANLRNMPRRNNFIQSTNILYSTGPLTESDIAALPQIKREQITMTDFLGSGAFGEVYEGCVTNVGSESEIRVAIKTLRKGATDQEKAEFLQEAQLMSNFKYEHILRLIGVCLDKDSLYIIMELMQGGDLLSYLRQCRPSVDTPSSLTLLDLVSMCVDVASGCRYLEEMHFVHRDLACRNCLVSSADPASRVVKIGDFGLARDIYKNDYYRKEGEGLLPVRWMSPESLVDGVFTSQSDIWAFGVLCWEIMTLGQQPYPARNNVEVLHYVREGGRLERPTDCPDDLYQLMLKCWSYSPEDRPTFRYCLDTLKSLQENTSDSIKITMQFTNWQPNGGIFNRTYLLADENHNNLRKGTLKFTSNDLPLLEGNSKEFNRSGQTSGSTTIIHPPKYLELIYNKDNDNEQPISLVSSDGYEMPRNDFIISNNNNNNNNNLSNINNNNNNNKNISRTFSNSSTVSELSTCNLVDNNNINKILTTVVKDDCSSMEALLPNGKLICNNNNNNNNNNSINNNS